MAGCRKKHSKLQQAHYKQYALENRAVVNRVKRLRKSLTNSITLKTHCSDELDKKVEQIKTAIEKARFRRKNPIQSTLTNSTKSRLQIIKFFTGKGDRNLISDNRITHSSSWLKLIGSKRKGKTLAGVSQRKLMNIGNNLAAETLKQLEIFKTNLKYN